MAAPWAALRPGPDFLDILDQRVLPLTQRYLHCQSGDDVVEAISTLAVRGAPLIGLVSIYGLWLYALAADPEHMSKALAAGADKLKRARPTAVNLAWAVDRAMAAVAAEDSRSVAAILFDLAEVVKIEDREQNLRIGNYGADFFSRPVSLLTHCNTGSLATAGYGTALGVIRTLHRRGQLKQVYVDETRPLFQGARLTAWELQQDSIAATVIPDSAAAFLISRSLVDAVVVGADRVAANGDSANKIGTLMLAIVAHHYGLPFVVAAPWTTVDLSLSRGDQIPIEERSETEVAEVLGHRILPEGVAAYNPAFDVTPASLITVIVTDRGAVRAPFAESLFRLKSN